MRVLIVNMYVSSSWVSIKKDINPRQAIEMKQVCEKMYRRKGMIRVVTNLRLTENFFQ